MISMTDHVAIGLETPRIDSGCSLKEDFIELILMDPSILLSQTINQFDSCHDYVRGPLT